MRTVAGVTGAVGEPQGSPCPQHAGLAARVVCLGRPTWNWAPTGSNRHANPDLFLLPVLWKFLHGTRQTVSEGSGPLSQVAGGWVGTDMERTQLLLQQLYWVEFPLSAKSENELQIAVSSEAAVAEPAPEVIRTSPDARSSWPSPPPTLQPPFLLR